MSSGKKCPMDHERWSVVVWIRELLLSVPVQLNSVSPCHEPEIHRRVQTASLPLSRVELHETVAMSPSRRSSVPALSDGSAQPTAVSSASSSPLSSSSILYHQIIIISYSSVRTASPFTISSFIYGHVCTYPYF